jgi:hypothetical protein
MRKNALLTKLSVGLMSLGLLSGVAWAETLAYWRFENGRAAAPISVGSAVVPDDSGRANALDVANADTQPLYTSDVPFATVPQTGARNALGADFRGQNDLFTRDAKLNSVAFGPNGSRAWTVELSLRVQSLGGVSRVFGRDGNTGGETRGPLQILVLGLHALRTQTTTGKRRTLALFLPPSPRTRSFLRRRLFLSRTRCRSRAPRSVSRSPSASSPSSSSAGERLPKQTGPCKYLQGPVYDLNGV